MLDEIFSENGQGIIYMWSIPIHAIVILGEMIYSHFNREKLYETKDVLSNVYLAILNYGLDLLMKGVSMAVMFFFIITVYSLGNLMFGILSQFLFYRILLIMFCIM
jgi:hypothetical protein